jgi:anti-anti-sigma factor
MELNYSETDRGVRVIRLKGNLDSAGVSQIETGFAGHCAGDNARVMVDVAEVEFLASIGIRLLLLNAKSVSSRGGKMVLLAPTPEVEEVLELTGILPVIPAYASTESAETALLA